MDTDDTLLEMEIDLAVKAVAVVRIGADGMPTVDKIELLDCRIGALSERIPLPAGKAGIPS